MEKQININLADYVDPPYTDWISGREFGEDKAEKLGLLGKIKDNQKFVIEIDDKVVKAINDSFIKGFFNSVFKELKSKDKVDSLFKIHANPYFKRLFDKNFRILDAIYNDDSTNK